MQLHDGYVTQDRIKETYNAKCHPAVMLERFNVHQVTDAFLAASFGNLEHITVHDFLEYYALTSSTIPCDKRFEVLLMKHWKVLGYRTAITRRNDHEIRHPRSLKIWSSRT
jgi:hypothetical protein